MMFMNNLQRQRNLKTQPRKSKRKYLMMRISLGEQQLKKWKEINGR